MRLLLSLIVGARKNSRPVPHHYIRLVTDFDPSTIPDVAPIKAIPDNPVKAEVIDVDAPSPAALEGTAQPAWVSEQKWLDDIRNMN